MLTLGAASAFAAATQAQSPLRPPPVHHHRITGFGAAPDRLSDARGFATAADGSVYVVDAQEARVQHVAPDGTVVNVWGGHGSRDGRVKWPVDVAVTERGAVVVVDGLDIRTFAANGTLQHAWTIRDRRELAPVGVAVAGDGTVVLASDHDVRRYTPDGALLGQWITASPGADHSTYREAIAVTADGSVVVADDEAGQVKRYDPDGTLLDAWFPPPLPDGRRRGLSGMALDDAGDLWLSDDRVAGIQRFSVAGDLLGERIAPAGLGRIAIAPDGTLTALDAREQRLHRIAPDGRALGVWGGRDPEAITIDDPEDVAFALDGTLLVVDSAALAVQRFDVDGRWLGTFGVPGAGSDAAPDTNEERPFDSPSAIDVAPDGTIYVADCGASAVLRFDATGAALEPWRVIPGTGWLRCPVGVTVAMDGVVWLADRGRHGVWQLAPDGGFVSAWAAKTWSLPGSGNPIDIGVGRGPNDPIYVGESDAYDLHRLTPWGTNLDSWRLPTSGLSGFGLAPDGTLYMAVLPRKYPDRSGSVRALDPQGTPVADWPTAALASGGNPDPAPRDVTVGADGRLYLPDPGAGAVEVYGTSYTARWHVTLFANRWLAGRPAAIAPIDDVGSSPDLMVDWGDGAPASGVPADDFSVRFRRHVPFTEGGWRFSVRAAGGMRLWVDDELVLDRFDARDVDAVAERWLPDGGHTLELAFNDPSGPASLALTWSPVPIPSPTPTPSSTATSTRTPRTPSPTAMRYPTTTPDATWYGRRCFLPVALGR